MRFDTRSQGPYHARAMGDPLRDRCLPRDLAAIQQVVEISHEIGTFTRLAEFVEGELSALESDNLSADWRELLAIGTMGFGFADATEEVVALELNLKAAVPAVCQRCLKAFEMPVETVLQLLLGGPDDSVVEHDGYEVWELAEEEFSPLEIIEEALIMAMPLSAMHENTNDCVEQTSAHVDEDRVDKEMTRPFASLRKQMDDEE